MCGRFASTQTDAELVRAFRVEEVVGEQLAPSYNVAPTQPVRAVLERTPREEPEAQGLGKVGP
jgi:putative SOS response-associated peptidase YedK